MPDRRGAEDARSALPQLLDAAMLGRSTLITRRGRPVAALVPAESALAGRSQQGSLLPLEGSGRGLWGSDSRRTIGKLRDEWNR